MAEIDLVVNAELEAAKAAIDGFKDSIQQLENSTEGADESTGGFSISLTELNQGLELAQKAFGYLQDAYNATIGVMVDYAAQVRDITAATGLETAEVSRMIEVADDAGVEVGSLKAALREMGKDGVAPTVDELANLAEKFQQIQDPAERTKFLLDNFGRAGLEMGKLMEQSADSIRNASAVLDDDMAQSARNAEIAFDGLQDAVRNIQIRIGAELVPTLTEAAKAMELLVMWNERITAAQIEHGTQLAKTTKSYEDYVAGIYQARLAAAGMQISLEQAREALLRQGGDYEKLSASMKGYTLIQWEQINATAAAEQETLRMTQVQTQASVIQAGYTEKVADYSKSLYEKMDAEKNAQATADLQVQSLADQKAAQEALTDASREYAVALSGAVSNEVQNFTDKQDTLKQKSADLQGEIDKLTAKSWLSASQRADLDELNQKLADNNTAIQENAAEHEKATKKIVLGYIEQSMAADGTSLAEQEAMLKVAASMGLVDQASVTAFESARKAVENFNQSGDLNQLISDADAAVKAIDGVAKAGQDVAPTDEKDPISTKVRRLEELDKAPTWKGVEDKLKTQQTKTEALQKAQETQAQVAATKLSAQATDPNWDNLHQQYAEAIDDAEALKSAIDNIPSTKTVTITVTTKYVTEGTPPAAAAGAVP